MKYSEDIKLEIGGKFINGDYYKNLKLLTKDLDKLIKNAKNEQLRIGGVSGSNSTLYSKCCNEEPHFRKKDNVEYYECPYCKQECEVEWMEDEFPDYCH